MSSQPQIAEPTPPFDALNPYPWFTWMRQHEQVYQDPNSSIWYVFGYQDVLRAMNPPLKPTPQDPIIFSSERPTGPVRSTNQGSIAHSDPPRQRAVRELLNASFSPKVLRDHYTSRITSIIDELIDQIIDAQQMDVIPSLAYAIPVLVITELLGVPEADRPMVHHWADQVIGRVAVEEASLTMRVPEMEQYFLQAVNQRRQQEASEHPDLITVLVHGSPRDGVALTQDELLGNCELLLIAGFETTAHLLANLFRVLDAFPDVQQQVWQDPSLAPALIEETLRYLSPVHFQARRTMMKVEIGGKVIPEHHLVFPLLSSANRDERVFTNAGSFELLRFAQTTPNHVAFGFRGAHFCLGAPLARLEATLMMQRLIERMEQIHLVAGVSLTAFTTNLGMVPAFNGVRSLPVAFKRR